MDKQQAHELLDDLDPSEFGAVAHLLEVLSTRRTFANAPVEEEEITAETAAALEVARASLARGEGVSHAEILREYGLSN